MSRYIKGETVVGIVTGIEKYGIFVSLDEYYSGLIHISEISDSFVRNVNNYVKIGETIKAKVLEEDENQCHLKLSIKNFDYKMNKNRRKKIEETGTGFKILKNSLEGWIKEKEAE